MLIKIPTVIGTTKNPTMKGAEAGLHGVPSPVQGAAAAAALAAKWAELNRRDTAIPLNTICGRNMRQILRVCDITLH